MTQPLGLLDALKHAKTALLAHADALAIAPDVKAIERAIRAHEDLQMRIAESTARPDCCDFGKTQECCAGNSCAHEEESGRAALRDAQAFRHIRANAPPEGVILRFYRPCSSRGAPSSSVTWGVPDYAAMEAENEGLRRYAQHDQVNCDKWQCDEAGWSFDAKLKCTCGLDKFLKGKS